MNKQRNYHITGIVYSYKDYQRKTWETTTLGPPKMTPEFLTRVKRSIADVHGNIESFSVMIETIEPLDVIDNDIASLTDSIKNDLIINK
jgi:hypothetical protein